MSHLYFEHCLKITMVFIKNDGRKIKRPWVLRSAMESKLKRQQLLADARRDLVIRAVRAAVTEGGLEGASIRDIARRAGYTPGALYAYFPSKQALFAAVLGSTLAGAQLAAQQAKLSKGGGGTMLHARAHAWFAYFLAHPSDAGLVLHLLASDGRSASQTALVRQLLDDVQLSLAPVAAALEVVGCPVEELPGEMAALLSLALGVLLVRDSRRLHTNNDLAFDAFALHLDRTVERYTGAPRVLASDDVARAQVDLFA
jgi:AcrR family transcriptional regulator